MSSPFPSLPTTLTTTLTSPSTLTTTPTPFPSSHSILTTTSPSPCTPSDDICENPQGDSISSSTYGLIGASVIILLLLFTTVLLCVLLWLRGRKKEPNLVDNISYVCHTHTIDKITAPQTANVNINAPVEVSTVASMPLSPSSVPQAPGESEDITTAANVAYESSHIATSVNPAYQPLQNSSNNDQEY